MGSPYHVHSYGTVHVVKTERGFLAIAKIVLSSAGIKCSITSFNSLTDLRCLLNELAGGDYGLLHDLLLGFDTAVFQRSRLALFLEARYEWKGWEKFQRSIVFDFTRYDVLPSNAGVL